MNAGKTKLTPYRILAVILIGIALTCYSYLAFLKIYIIVFESKFEAPYLYRSYMPWRQLLVVGICIMVFVLILLFNMYVKHQWISALVNVVLILALCNPYTLALGVFVIPTTVNNYTIESSSEFYQCAFQMRIDFSNFPKYDEFDDQDVRFVGKVSDGFFFYQSITAIVKYDSLEQCETDYDAYIDSHEFLTEPAIDNYGGDYVIAAPEFDYEGIYFKVLTEGEDDNFPKSIYMIGIDRNNATLYYLYLDDHDLDYLAEFDAQDLEVEMRKHVATQYNLGG